MVLYNTKVYSCLKQWDLYVAVAQPLPFGEFVVITKNNYSVQYC